MPLLTYGEIYAIVAFTNFDMLDACFTLASSSVAESPFQSFGSSPFFLSNQLAC
jgi:hypothetical protein